MQVTAKVTELTALTTTDITAIGNYLSEVGAVALAIIASYDVYRWIDKATGKRDVL